MRLLGFNALDGVYVGNGMEVQKQAITGAKDGFPQTPKRRYCPAALHCQLQLVLVDGGGGRGFGLQPQQFP